jgi:sigma-B regulation protein RsbU (phosphoserine phosphatase)
MRILLVEDDAVVRTVLVNLVRQLGHDPVVAVDGETAWNLHQAEPFGVVISDWVMPGMDGLALLQRMRERDGDRAYTYFILLTANDAPEHVEQAIAAGVDDHLSKPVRRTELLARLTVASRIVSMHVGLNERSRLLGEANRRMRRDLSAAANAQKNLLPQQLPELPGLSLGWRFQPCEECAGDLLGVTDLGDGLLGLHLFDVSGHGVVAALQAVQVARVLPELMRRDPRPLALATALNATFHQPRSLRFVTLVYGLFNSRTRQLDLVSCAHPSPLILRADGSEVVEEICAHPIGMFSAAEARFHAWTVQLQPGDRVLFTSDGALEAPGNEPLDPGAPFGVERLSAVWKATRQRPMEDALTEVMDALAIWRGTGHIADDITLLGLGLDRPA